MAENKIELKKLDLTCPYCGSHIMVLLEPNPNKRSFDDPSDVPSAYECTGIQCWAEWDLLGNPTDGPGAHLTH